MQIYRLGSLLVMVLQVNADFSFEAKSEADKNNAKVQEWERLMERFQRVDTSVSSKWQLMSSIFSLSDNK
jgi:L-rhamnose mutarotase